MTSGIAEMLVGRRAATRSLTLTPCVFALAALGVLTFDHFHRLGLVAVILALMTLIAALARAGIALVEVQTLADVTAQLRSARHRAEIEQRYRLALTASGDGMFDLDLRTGRAFWSERLLEMLGYGPDQVPQTTHSWFALLVHPDDHAAFHAGANAAVQPDGRFETEARLRRADGAYVRYSVRGCTQRDERGKRVRMIGAVHDVSADRRAELQRLALARELHDGVVQDLAASAIYAASARRALDSDPARAGELLDVVAKEIQNSTASMRLLLQSLRADTSLLEAGSSIDAALRVHIEEFTRAAPQVALDVDVETAPALAPTPVALQTMSHVMREALRNVAQHAHASRVTILLRAEEAGLRLRLDDNGVGFDRDRMPVGHFGLIGMAERARAAGGELRVESLPGAGTRVQLYLPRPFEQPAIAARDLRRERGSFADPASERALEHL